MKKIILLLVILSTFHLFSQDFDYLPIAKEVWSEPVKVDTFALPYRYESEASFTSSMDTIYYFKSTSVYTSFYKNGNWITPQVLNGYVNDGNPIRCPVISKDGNRLYFSAWRGDYGAWDLYCCYRDSTTNDWGPAENLGPKINNYWGDYYAYELSPDTLYCINDRWAGMGVCVYIKNNISNEWEIIDSSNYHHPFGAGDIRGLCITADRKKAYFSRYISADHTGDSLQSELHVTYWDTLNNRWGDSYRLNINSKAYEIKVDSNWAYWVGGADEYPWISPDGKTLYFASNRDAARKDSNDLTPDIYVSHLIIDDKGDSVTAVSGNDIKKNTINELKLLPNYPNPFNPGTNITFELPQNSNISLIIYDILGKEKEKLIDNIYYYKGTHNLKWNVKNSLEYCSGIYFLRLITKNSSITNKLIYIK